MAHNDLKDSFDIYWGLAADCAAGIGKSFGFLF
jgi:hypothetical protein